MNKVVRNFKLLFDDIVDTFKIIYRDNKLEKQNFAVDNRREVLLLYRHMIKVIPPMHNSLLEKRCAYEEIKFNFSEAKGETDFDTICFLKNTCYVIIEKINKGVYPPFPKYIA